MLHDYLLWISSKHVDELLMFLSALLVLDAPRYLLGKICALLCDLIWPRPAHRDYCPTVCVILAGYNESANIANSAASLHGTYSKLQIIIVDDGSTDDSFQHARQFARTHQNVLALRRPNRGGKASATNWAMVYNRAEVTIIADADSTYAPDAVWEIIQPLKDPAVGGVSAPILVKNSFHNLLTWLQSYEYLHSIAIGRRASELMNLLGIVSGAFGAFRTDVLRRIGVMDVGPPEDLDATLRLRRSGYRIAYAPHAYSYTDVPDTLRALTNQRIRWEQGGVVRNHCRKHLEMILPTSPNFRLSNLLLWLETVWFELISPFVILGYFYWLFWTQPVEEVPYILFWVLASYFLLEGLQAAICFYFTDDWKRDLLISLVFPLMAFYRTYLLFVRVYAVLTEILGYDSYHDNYVPQRVREATWKY